MTLSFALQVLSCFFRRILAHRAAVCGVLAFCFVGLDIQPTSARQLSADDPATNVPAAELPASEPPKIEQPATTAPDTKAEESSDDLPWKSRMKSVVPVLRQPASPVEVLERFNIGDSQIASFISGLPIESGEEDVLVRILYRYPRLGRDNLLRWRQKDVSWDQLIADPNPRRGQIFLLKGEVQQIEAIALLPELVRLLEYKKYYRVEMKLDGSEQRAVVYTRFVPTQWKVGAPINEPATIDAMFLKAGAEDEDKKVELYFCGETFSWFPTKADPTRSIGPLELRLATWGFDVGLLDHLRKTNGKPILPEDREAFYEFLDIAPRVAKTTPRFETSPELDITKLMVKPESEHGAIYQFEASAVRIVKVLVEEPDVRARFGINHYYEVDLFIPLRDKIITLGKSTKENEAPTYRNTFPVTVLLRELPPGITEGEDLDETLRCEALFFKVWSYQSGFTEKFEKLQPAPMMIGLHAEKVLREGRPSNVLADLVVGGAIVVVAIMVLALVFIFWRNDRNSKKQRSADQIDKIIIPSADEIPTSPPS